MKKLLTLVIVFSLAFVLNSVSFAQEVVVESVSAIAPEAAAEVTTVEGADVHAVQDCYAPVHSCPLFRPFVRRACTPCVANPCQPCPSYAPQPVVVPAPCGCDADSYGDPCGPRRPGILARLFSKRHSSHCGYNSDYPAPVGCPCGHPVQ